jgi:hypothetical protein
MEDLTYTRAQNSSSVSPRKLAPSNPLEPRLVRGLFYLRGTSTLYQWVDVWDKFFSNR